MMEVKEEEEDRLSALWDSIILEILMHLPYTQTQCAIKTLTLSKRWLHLWTDYFNIKYHNPISSIWPSAFPGFEYVAETLIQCRRSNLAKFHITGNYSDLLQPHVNNWIRYAVNCEVKDLDIIFNNTEYVLDDFFFINSCFTRLNLFGCVFNPTGAISWNKLTRLSLSHTELDEDMIENILSGCPALETFELGYCNGYTLLDITSKSVKNLVITGYGDPEADEYPDIVKINAPYISSLTIGGSLLVWNILVLNVSSLIEGNLNFIKCENSETSDEDMFGLTICLLHAKKLNIGILCNKVFSRLEARGFSFPSNLKVLDSEDEANSLIWHGSYGDSLNSIEEEEEKDWKCFHTRVRSASSLDGRITVKLLEDETKVKDRISALPDGLLIEILSRLPKTKYAIRTSTLSKRWRHIWTYIPTLIFKRGYGDDFLTSDFFMSVDQTLAQCRHLKLNKFELHCCDGYDIQFESRVKDWIHHVISLNVEELYLDLFNRGLGLEAEFVLDEFFYTNSCITKMTLQGCIFTPTGAIHWEKLKSLCINRGILNEDLIENILSGSPMLETLELINCSGYMRLDVTSKSVKNLIFRGYLDVEDEFNFPDMIEINAPYILSLTICHELLLGKLVLLNVGSLINAHLDYSMDMIYTIRQEQILKELILSLQHVKEVKIGIDCFKAFFRLEATGFAFPSNLKVLDSLEGIPDWSDWSDWSDLDDSDEDSNGDWKELRSSS